MPTELLLGLRDGGAQNFQVQLYQRNAITVSIRTPGKLRLYAAGRDRKAAVKLISSAAYLLLTMRGFVRLGISSSCFMVKFDQITIALCPPSVIIPTPHWHMKFFENLRADPASMAFQLNIWAPDKVLNIEQYGNQVDIVSFRRGDWEQVLLNLFTDPSFEAVNPSGSSAMQTFTRH